MASPQSSHRVLIIDDDPSLIAVLSDILSMVGGYDVHIARDGASGLESIFTVLPSCVVVDVRMPGLNGFQFVRAVRGDPSTADIPLVILSAMVQDRDVVTGLLSGVDEYLFKPVKMDDLLGAIERAIAITAEQREQRALLMAEEGEDGA
jgi:CheY-like chemotaxis protein